MTDEQELTLSLQAILDQLQLNCPVDGFVTYLQLLVRWNKAYNLTAVRNVHDMVTRHILDSLVILPWIKGASLLDVGTGAGLPGIPLALARPDLHVVLLDSNGKKVRFLKEVKRILSLNNVDVVQSRAEDYHPHLIFDTVTSRALTHVSQMIDWTAHLIAPKGIWLAMKGVYPEIELTAVTKPYHVETYVVDKVLGERCLCIIENDEGEH